MITITTSNPWPPGSVIYVDGQPVRVVTATGVSMAVRPLGYWEGWRVVVCHYARRLQARWLRRVWWPLVDRLSPDSDA